MGDNPRLIVEHHLSKDEREDFNKDLKKQGMNIWYTDYVFEGYFEKLLSSNSLLNLYRGNTPPEIAYRKESSTKYLFDLRMMLKSLCNKLGSKYIILYPDRGSSDSYSVVRNNKPAVHVGVALDDSCFDSLPMDDILNKLRERFGEPAIFGRKNKNSENFNWIIDYFEDLE